MRARVLTTSILTALLGPVLFVSAITPKEPAGGSGKAPSTAPSATTSHSPEQPWFKFAGQRAVPAYLKVDKATTVDADGLRGEGFTADSDFINKDFVFDVLFDPKQDRDGKPFSRTDVIVGIGQNEHNGGSAWCKQSVALRLRETRAVLIDNAKGKERELTRLAAADDKPAAKPKGKKPAYKTLAVKPGPCVIRLEKKGSAMMLSACFGYTGEFTPDVTATIDDLSAKAPFLTSATSTLFLWSHLSDESQPVFLAVRLSVNGVPLDPPASGVAGPGRIKPVALDDASFFRFTPAAALPGYLTGGEKVYADGAGLHGGEVRTASVDLINHDFTFDLLYKFKDDENSTFVIGIGENAREGGWILSSLCSLVNSPARGGKATITQPRRHEAGEVGTIGRNPGPHVFRLQKIGNTLTMALCVNYKGTFEPTYSKTLPDLKSLAPYLTDKNSALFFSPERLDDQSTSTWLGVRLVVDGKLISGGTGGAAGAAPTVSAGTPRGGPNTPAQPPATAPPAPRDPAVELPLPAGEHHFIADGADGRSLLLLERDALRRLGPDGFTVTQTLKLPKPYDRIAERPDYFLALSADAKTLDLLDRSTLQVKRAIPMDYRSITDLALHPRSAICYVAVERAGDGPRHAILEVNERTGDVREPQDFIGNWVKISPDGSRLYAGYKDTYEKGMRLLANPDRWDVIPEYGDIDLLIVYDITRLGSPREIALKKEAGANGFGIVLSADGRRLSYLSYVGYPLYSDNVPAWDPADLVKRPVSYPTKANGSTPTKIAFHPILPIAAAPTATGAVAFGRETGQVELSRFDLTHPLTNGDKAVDARFSPDGRWLILTCQTSTKALYLHKVKLNLSDDESKACERLPLKPPPIERRAAPGSQA